ncbi:MAG: amidase [Rhodobacteraceae bacterium]|nr:MAG: amidase [Paracoccaceae bacterium]
MTHTQASATRSEKAVATGRSDGSDELATHTASELQGLLADRHCKAIDIAEAVLRRIDLHNPSLNALVQVDPDTIRAQARAADDRIAAGETGALLGIPVSIKDTLWIKGQVTTAGSDLYRYFVAPEDAPVVARLRAAGAVILGASNCSEFACRGVTENRVYGRTSNPWNTALTPGGSSGGAASATAAGLGCLGIGTDAGGSVRRPAAHTGLVGMKPSAGRIAHAGGFDEPVYGHSVIGLMARSVADITSAMSVLSGPDVLDPQSVALPCFAPTTRRPLRLGFSPRLGRGFAVDPDVAVSIAAIAEKLSKAGHHVELCDPDWPDGAEEDALMPLQFAGLAAIYGHAYQDRAWQPDPDIARQIEAGLALDGVAVSSALELRKALFLSLARVFEQFDLLITPTTPVTAWPKDRPEPEKIEGRPAGPRGHAAFTPIFNHCFVPACSVPCGLDAVGLPIGLQIVGPIHADPMVLALATEVEKLISDQGQHNFSSALDPRGGLSKDVMNVCA